tara:strand:+ start:275 stop:520 length:246 start_codon:yes stop_codon:yes gene_type:complete
MREITNGKWVPSEAQLKINDVTAPPPNCIRPIKDDAFPAISGYGDIASAVAADTTRGKPIIKAAAGRTTLKGSMISDKNKI